MTNEDEKYEKAMRDYARAADNYDQALFYARKEGRLLDRTLKLLAVMGFLILLTLLVNVIRS